ncbi:MAG TPA: copper resistance protein NlpE N-terminal domain-containing protein [Bacteroidales bacterium]|nr:copper resistance protein NlpE N-terminal domain-containing protein [Bacteroidales bacterium]HOR60991.1 copper resistance protein NlpE N-terminal domain-containing protein [Bacteroidales bacterium]HPL05405.1 copper resistance protein NlpE N-terminal domain-containing protein [Bacteroidales bacterium]
MKTINFFIGLCVIFSLFACNNKNADFIYENSAKNTIDWAGTYWGIIPCADCPGIETKIKINSDESFVLTTNYLEVENSENIIEGKFTWTDNGNSIELSADSENENPTILKIEKNQIKYLNLDGKEIEGELADNYTLTKNGNSLVDNKKWKIIEICGEEVEGDENELFMNFNAEDAKVYAKVDCNLMDWEYEIHNKSEIEFSQLTTTLMFCPDSLEDQFIEAIKQADNISTDGKTLSINNADMLNLLELELIKE